MLLDLSHPRARRPVSGWAIGVVGILGIGAATATLERIRASLAENLPRAPVPVSASIGAVTFAVPPEDIEDLVRAGDAQMYTAKAAGRNRVELHVFGGGGIVKATQERGSA